MKFVTLLLSYSLVKAVQYTQTMMYNLQDCQGQPQSISLSQQGICSIPTMENYNQCSGLQQPYLSQKQTCVSSFDTKSLIQVYVVKKSFIGSSSCEGDPTSIDGFVGDANCHQISMNPPSYLSVNCNGGNPIYKTCKDSGCSSCTEEKYQGGKCQVLGGSASMVVECLKPGGGGVIGGGDADSGALSTGQTVGLTLMALQLLYLAN